MFCQIDVEISKAKLKHSSNQWVVYILQFVKKQEAWPSNIGYNVKSKLFNNGGVQKCTDTNTSLWFKNWMNQIMAIFGEKLFIWVPILTLFGHRINSITKLMLGTIWRHLYFSCRWKNYKSVPTTLKSSGQIRLIKFISEVFWVNFFLESPTLYSFLKSKTQQSKPNIIYPEISIKHQVKN